MLVDLATALAKAQGELKVAVKDTKNPFFNSKYADLSSVWGACRKALSDNGLSVVQLPVDSPLGPEYVGLRTMLLHTSGQSLESTFSMKPGKVKDKKTGEEHDKDDPQVRGSVLTYMRRYALAAFVGIVADDDDDGNAASQGQVPSKRLEMETAMRKYAGTSEYVKFVSAIDEHVRIGSLSVEDRGQLLLLHRELTGGKK